MKKSDGILLNGYLITNQMCNDAWRLKSLNSSLASIDVIINFLI